MSNGKKSRIFLVPLILGICFATIGIIIIVAAIINGWIFWPVGIGLLVFGLTLSILFTCMAKAGTADYQAKMIMQAREREKRILEILNANGIDYKTRNSKMYCEYCGSEIPLNSNKCEFCGAKLKK